MAKAKILVVEDEIIIAMEIADRLKSMGYDVLRIVSNGEMAIESAQKEHPDLILMDIMIQGDMDGIETATKIRAISNIPVIYLTANADESTLERAKISDAFGYLIKPFEEKELNTSIEMALYKHQMEAKLKESKERFKSLVENSSIGIFRLSKEGRILLANQATIKILGYNNFKDIQGKNISEFVVGGKRKSAALSEILISQNKIQQYKVELKNVNGSRVIISLGGSLIKWGVEILYFDGTMEDITKQQLYEEVLIKAKEKAEESDRLKTEFLAGMSHEIRTPVNTIMSYLSLLKSDLDLSTDSTYEEIFDAIEVGSMRLTRTIDSILNMAQFQAGTFDVFKEKVDIVNDVLENLYNEFLYTAKQRSLDFYFSNEASSTKIIGDKYSLSQLFVNLIDNALKYTKAGFIKIKSYNDENGVLSVDVEDSGIGIGEEFLPTLFKPFTQEEQGYTRRFDGNGLGLALVKRYCELNNSLITVQSTKGKGTKFTIKFTSTNKNSEYKSQQEINNENVK